MSRIVQRVLPFIIRRSNPDYKIYYNLGFSANNIKEEALYQCRQALFNHDKYLSKTDLYHIFYKMAQYHENNLYYDICPHVCEQLLGNISQMMKDYFKANKDYKKHPSKYTGRPQVPKYPKKNQSTGFSLDNEEFSYKHHTVYIHKNNKNSRKWKREVHTNLHLPKQFNIQKVDELHINPHKYYISLSVVYDVVIPDTKQDNGRYLCVDPGLNNAFCVGSNCADVKPIIINGRPMKYINQMYNKDIARTQSVLQKMNHKSTSHKLDYYFTKRYFRLMNYGHEASKSVIDYALSHDISRIVVGNGMSSAKRHPQLSKRNNQNFIQVPMGRFVHMLQYLGANVGIPVYIVNESYTSQSSFVDHENPCWNNGNTARQKRAITYHALYNKKLYKRVNRRVRRGLYIPDNQEWNHPINADLDGALQIMKKKYPTAFSQVDVNGMRVICHSPKKITLRY